MGVWIETVYPQKESIAARSHPVWVCGLKHYYKQTVGLASKVTPCMGVWIETVYPQKESIAASHTLYGCVD